MAASLTAKRWKPVLCDQTRKRRHHMIEEHLPVRLSHLLRDCSVGAIVRGPDSLMVVQDTRTWDRAGSDPLERQIRYVDRVRSALGISELLCVPPRAVERNGTVTGWIPALRFPTWMRCLRCGLMHSAPWRKQPSKSEGSSHPDMAGPREPGNCEGCGGPLEQTPWVLIHEKGYLADVPWHDLAHRDSFQSGTASVPSRLVECLLDIGREPPGPPASLQSLPFPNRLRQEHWIANSVSGGHVATTLDTRAARSTPR